MQMPALLMSRLGTGSDLPSIADESKRMLRQKTNQREDGTFPLLNVVVISVKILVRW